MSDTRNPFEGMELGDFGMMMSGLFDGGKDRGARFPVSDAEDLHKGASHIPDRVTDLRRSGQTVLFYQPDRTDPRSWYWLESNGNRIPYE